jgi:hypothetical protein
MDNKMKIKLINRAIIGPYRISKQRGKINTHRNAPPSLSVTKEKISSTISHIQYPAKKDKNVIRVNKIRKICFCLVSMRLTFAILFIDFPEVQKKTVLLSE